MTVKLQHLCNCGIQGAKTQDNSQDGFVHFSYLKMGKEKNKSKLEDASILPACTKTNVAFSFLLLNVKEESLHIFWLRPDPHRNRILRWYRGPLLQLSIYF